MRAMRMVAALVLLTGLGAIAVSQPPGEGEGKGGRKGKDGPPRFELGQIFPPPLEAELNLTEQQQQQLDSIKKDLKAKLEKLLTDEQKKTVENFRPRRPPGGGPGGKGGKGGGGKGGEGGKGDRPPFEKD